MNVITLGVQNSRLSCKSPAQNAANTLLLASMIWHNGRQIKHHPIIRGDMKSDLRPGHRQPFDHIKALTLLGAYGL